MAQGFYVNAPLSTPTHFLFQLIPRITFKTSYGTLQMSSLFQATDNNYASASWIQCVKFFWPVVVAADLIVSYTTLIN